MKQRLYRFFILCLSLVLLTACSAGTSSSFTDRDASSSTTESQTNQSEEGSVEEKTEEDTRAEDSVQPEDIQVAGLELQSWTEYQVYLEPTETCTPAFDPIYVSIIFESATYCHLTYNGQTIELGRFLNDKYIDLFTMTDDYDETLAINGKCDTNCTDADFAIRVSSFIQGERAICLFGDEPVGIPDWSQIMETTDTEPEEPVVFRAGDQKIVQGEFYLFRIIPDES